MSLIGARTERIDSLDFLRGIAISGVIAFHTLGIFHADAWFTKPAAYGFFGVQLFFIVSALTMCTMWDRRRAEDHPALKFYVRRLCRIAGPFWIAILLYLWLAPPGFSDDAPEGIGGPEVISSALFLHTLWVPWINSIVPGGWSIGIEVLFYVFFPLLIRANGAPRFYLLVGLMMYLTNVFLVQPAGVHLLSAYANQVSVANFLDRQFFYQGPVFLIGIALYKQIKAASTDWLGMAIVIVWLLLAFFAKSVGFRGASPGFWLPVFSMALLAYAIISIGFSWKPLASLGGISYSVYLSHFAILFCISAAFDWFSLSHTEVSSFFTALVLATLASAVVGRFSRRLIEEPSSDVGRWIISRYGTRGPITTEISSAGRSE
ncbi:acyltransferase [Bradyrhizobium sp. WYCCWR 13023]|uniref:Acyltransferase n=1 Tax=Bradyrhizobium zhengyangense TaxID=2911009 RepID=A0A9X1UFN1_9BRAD|nr:acyltransferase [Bradyrhizobium zhengyangense]MCG2633193.1 acyltransferase [Bradyrhizobium zhengyangense]